MAWGQSQHELAVSPILPTMIPQALAPVNRWLPDGPLPERQWGHAARTSHEMVRARRFSKPGWNPAEKHEGERDWPRICGPVSPADGYLHGVFHFLGQLLNLVGLADDVEIEGVLIGLVHLRLEVGGQLEQGCTLLG